MADGISPKHRSAEPTSWPHGRAQHCSACPQPVSWRGKRRRSDPRGRHIWWRCKARSADIAQRKAFVFRSPAFRFSGSAELFCKNQTARSLFSAWKRTSGCLWGKPIRSIYRSVQLSMKLRTHICRAPVHWQSRKLNPCLSIAWNQQIEPLGFLKLLSTCFR